MMTGDDYDNGDNDDVEDLLHLSRTPAPRAAESWGEPPAQPANSLIEDKKLNPHCKLSELWGKEGKH